MSAPASASSPNPGASILSQDTAPSVQQAPPGPSVADIPELSAPLSTDALNALHDFSTVQGTRAQTSLVQTPQEEHLRTGAPFQIASTSTPPKHPSLAPALFMPQQQVPFGEVRNMHMLPTPPVETADKPNLGYLSPAKFTPESLTGIGAPTLGAALSAPSVHETRPARPVSPLVPVIEIPRPMSMNTGLVDPELMGVPESDLKALAPPASAPVTPVSTTPVVKPADLPASQPVSNTTMTMGAPRPQSYAIPAAAHHSSTPDQVGTSRVASGSHTERKSEARPPPASDPQFRWVLGDYMLGKTLGAGSMGKVKLGMSRIDNEKVAVKIVPRNTSVAGLRQHIARAQQNGATEVAAAAQSENAMARAVAKDKSKEVRIVREGSLQILLRHPYVCGMHEMIVHQNHYYMVFEYINGGQMLDYIISHGRLRERSARSFARQIGSALQYCHAHNVVHRDLKIENILISKSGNIKIIDFGLSNLYSPQSQLSTFCGSLYFAAPELLNARPYRGPEVDVWSFGIVLYVLVCGKVPFDDQSMPALHAKIKRGHVEYPPWLSTECKHLLSRMLVTNPITRATLPEVLSHPWMTRGYDGPPNPFIPNRKPLRTADLDNEVIEGMTGFEFGTSAEIRQRLEQVLESEEYRNACHQWENEGVVTPRAEIAPLPHTHESDSAMLKVARRISGIDFYRKKMHTKEHEAPQPPPAPAPDPTRGYHPLISIYYLVAERLERIRLYGKSSFASSDVSLHKESRETTTTTQTTAASGGHQVASIQPMPTSADIPHDSPRVPEETHVSPRATDATPSFILPPPPPRAARLSPVVETPTPVFESRQKSQPQGVMAGPPRARAQPDELESSLRAMNMDSERRNSKMLPSMPEVSEAHVPPRRSISLHAPQFNPRTMRASTMGAVRPIAEETQSANVPAAKKSPSPRPVSVALPDDESKRSVSWKGHRPSEPDTSIPSSPAFPMSPALEAVDRPSTSMSLAPSEERSEESAADSKPVFLKGLFSVQTTSTRPRSVIRADLVRVLEQMCVSFREIRGGFECVYTPSVAAGQGRTSPMPGGRGSVSATGSDKDDASFMPHSKSQLNHVPMGGHGARPDSTHLAVQKDSGESAATGIGEVGINGPAAVPPSPQTEGSNLPDLNVHFEVFVVKVPLLLGFNGLQFRRVSGNPWQYQMLARCILQELKL
ncbi:non-specific serine/threonine protein kinase [Malassezia cuniculi]|uniref:non-specific serine/threonine protein kinase n=1 Tax=Malassezia cuniculi TaxID=948313 RepID=A0AAF0J869_9BASI|nr:non-specific serine/threonine protein kinase [Malassezia cuniculi]